MPIKNAIHSQQVYDPTDDSIMAEQELCMERLYACLLYTSDVYKRQVLQAALCCGAGLKVIEIGHDHAVGFHLAGGVLEDGAAVNRRDLLADTLGGCLLYTSSLAATPAKSAAAGL